MAQLRLLAPHDPVPDAGRYLIVMRRFAEEAPSTVITEMITSDGRNAPVLTVPTDEDGRPLDFDAATRAALAQAEREGLDLVHAVDRTAGPREQEVLAHGGDHAVHLEELADTDLTEGEPGTDIRDRPAGAGTNLTPAHPVRHRGGTERTRG